MHVFKLLARPAPACDGLVSDCGAYVLQRRQVENLSMLAEVTAISYAWGLLPHRVAATWFGDATGDALTVKLGTEWDSRLFLDELVRLSARAWLWLDQLSLRQCNASTTELNISIPAVFKNAAVLVLLPGSDCVKREQLIRNAIARDWIHATFGNNINITRSSSYRSAPVVWKLMAHKMKCACLCGIDMWLQRVWPWQEAAYASRLQLRFVAGNGVISYSSFDGVTLLRQQVLDKRWHSSGRLKGLAGGRAASDRDEDGDMMFLRLLHGDQVVFKAFSTPAGSAMLQYMTNYVEQNRTCTKDVDMISAVAPSIGTRTMVERSLSVGVKDLVEYIKAATGSVYVGPLPRGTLSMLDRANFTAGSSYMAHERTFSSLDEVCTATKMSFLHGTHFAPGYTKDHDLLTCVDHDIQVKDLPKPADSRSFSLGALLLAMSVGQRRMLVRWLKSWEPREGGCSEIAAVIADLKDFAAKTDVTSESEFEWRMKYIVKTSSVLFTRLALILLRIIDDETSDMEASLARHCHLVVIENAGKATAVGYHSAEVRNGGIAVVAVGDCLMLGYLSGISIEIAKSRRDRQNRFPQFDQHPGERLPECHIFGRVPFVDRASIGFRSRFTARIRHGL